MYKPSYFYIKRYYLNLGVDYINFFTLILKNPFRNKTRSALSIVGIAIGIATIVALGLITTGMENSVQSTFNEGGAEITVSNSTAIGGTSGLLNSHVCSDLKNTSGVLDTAGELSVTDTASSNPMSDGTNIIGISPDKLSLAGINKINGSFFKNNTHEAIVGAQYAEMSNISVGDKVSFLNNEFKIVGIFETGNIFTDGGVYVPLDTLQGMADTDKFSSVLVKTTEGANDTLVSKNIENDFSDVSTITSEEMSSMMGNVLGILDTVSLAVSGLAIIVGAIGIVNTMVMTVYERTKEIGVLKSIGWKSSRILAMILGETLVLTILSGIIGSAFGILIAEIGVILMGDSDFALGYDPHTFILAFGITIIVGIIGGVYPAYKASKLAPTEALRYE